MTVQPNPLALAVELASMIAEVERDMADDIAEAENNGERPDLWGYGVELSLDKAKAILAALRTDQDARLDGEGVEQFLLAYVSQDAKIIGIEHDTDADWHEVQRAHEALRDRLNVRLAERDKCPVKPSPPTQ